MKIFYSWQSDTPSEIGKAFVRSALDLALKKIEASLDLDEAERPSIDQDTQGVMGSPVIAETIFEKIRNSEVVVADVTLVGKVVQDKKPIKDKKLINSNVGYELGFAHGYHGDHVFLKVMNTHYGPPEDLPFDLGHRRWPVRFELSPNATKETRKKAREKLAKEFATILGEYIKKKGQTPPQIYKPTPSTDNPAMYWCDGEYLVDETLSAESYTNPLKLGYTSDQPLTYMRIWPDASLEELKGSELQGLISKGLYPLLERVSGAWYERNKYGIISYNGRDEGYLRATTQAFKNREIWGVDATLLSARESSEKYNFDFVSIAAFQRGIVQSLKKYLKIAEDLGYPQLVNVEVGMVNVEGFKIALPHNSWDDFSGPIFEDILVKTTVNQGDPSSFDLAISQIFEKVYDAAGIEIPKNGTE